MGRTVIRDWMERRNARKVVLAVGVVLALGLAYWLGSRSPDEEPGAAVAGPTVAELARAKQDGESRAQERYAAGVAEGRAAFAPGTARYRRIYSKGMRAGRDAMAGKIRAQYEKGVRVGKAAAQRSYSSGREAGYDAGYDDGWDDGYDEGFDDSLGEPSGPSGGAEDLPDIGYDLDCSDFGGPVYVSPGDPHDLDRDGDGIGCE